MEANEGLAFCERWLPAWTGNRPDRLIGFYAADALYLDPARPDGLRGHAEILPYFEKLLAANPDWRWEVVEVIPTTRGFVAKWKATIPVGDRIVVEHGADIVEVEADRITRNEVYFDRMRLMAALRGAG